MNGGRKREDVDADVDVEEVFCSVMFGGRIASMMEDTFFCLFVTQEVDDDDNDDDV
jgi:hypothetical protein